ncbi:DUF402 domain-containing protein [Deinococcus sp. KNUC1210]|uniref:DUF402 domain-containing protein n=1 Tax=Deinococcus sp. KNUC1210 TaxID=2917691 RepID=UPI001EF1576D|nr:DUF402 domain-containing protein [Deinococcus sp. KNUC1210]ULH15479.1 DUF402 domain-containing protein [Deinococcus sp. KNUC1210]
MIHPVRVHTIDLGAQSILLDGGQVVRALSRAEVTPYGLHYANDVPDHPHLTHVEAHLIPALDLIVSHFTDRPGSPHPSRFYLDMATVTVEAEAWTIRDLYLDVVVGLDGQPFLHDADEYAAAIAEGYLTPDELSRAVLSAQRVVNGLFAHHNDLEAWLASLDIHLEWWRLSPAATMQR